MRDASEAAAQFRDFGETPHERLDRAPKLRAVCLLCNGPLELCKDGLFDTRFGLDGRYDVWRCLECGLEQLFPAPEPKTLKALYEAHYNFGGETGTLYAKMREQFLLSFLSSFWSWLDGDISFYRLRGPGRLLDIGCNEGRGLRIYARNGYQVEGLELNETAASVARSAGFVVHTDLLEEFWPENLYDVAILSNVLEHSLDPHQMLSDVHRILVRGGKVRISCPNSGSWLRAAFGRFWINWHVPYHITHFSQGTLRRSLTELGFVDVEVHQRTPALWVAQSIITALFSKEGRKTRELRNPLLTLLLMMLARFVFFPLLWVGNKFGRGDCLLAVATKA